MDNLLTGINFKVELVHLHQNFMLSLHSFISNIEPKNYSEALNDCNWLIVMQEELNQLERNKV